MSWVRDLFARPWRRYTAYGFLTLLGLLIVLRVLAFAPFAHNWVEARVEAMAVRGQSVSLDNLRGDLLGRMRADKLVIADTDGTWLIVEEIDLTWSPLALIGGHLDLAHVRADVLSVARRPALSPASASTQASPIDRFDLRDLNVETLNLAGGVAGPAQSYALAGRVKTDGLAGTLGLDLRPTAIFGDTARIDLDWGGPIPLQGEVSIEGAPSGLIATLLGLPSGQAMSASLLASGSPAAWDLQADATAGDENVLTLNASHMDDAFGAEGRLDLSAFGRLQVLRDRLGDTLDIRGEFTADQRTLATLISPNGRIDIDGRMVEAERGLAFDQLSLTAEGLDMAAISGLPDLTLPALSYSGAFSWMDNLILLSGPIAVPEVSYRDYAAERVAFSGTYQFAADAIAVTSPFQVNQIDGLPEAVADVIGPRIEGALDAQYSIADRRLDVQALEVESNGHSLDLAGTRLSDGALDFNGTVALTSLAMFEEASGDWTVEGHPTEQLFASLSGALRPAANRPELAALIGPHADFDFQVETRIGRIRIEAAELRSDQLSAIANGTISSGEIALTASARADELTYEGTALDALAIDLDLSGSVSQPKVLANARAEQLRAFGERFASPELVASLDLSPTRAGSLELTAGYRDAPLTTSLSTSMDGAKIEVSDLRTQWGELIATGQGALDLEAIQRSAMDLDISGQAPLVGDLTGLVRFSEEVLALDLSTRDVDLGGVDINQSRLALAGQWPLFEGAIAYDGRLPVWGSDEAFSGRHAVQVNPDQSRLSIGGEARLADQVFELIRPLELTYGESAALTGRVSAFGGEVGLKLDPSGAARSEITFGDLQFSELGAFLQRPGLDGQLTGNASVQILDGDLLGDADIAIEKLRRGVADSADLSVEADIDAGALSMVLTGSNDAGDLSLDGQMQTELIHGGTLFSIRPDPNAPMPIRLVGQGPLAPLWALAAQTDLRLEGDFMADLNNGDGSSLRFSGPVAWRNGVFEDGFTGLHLVDIAVEADLSAEEIRLREASASGVKGGTLNAAGAYNFNGDGDIVVDLDRVNAANRSDVEARVSGQARVDRRNRQTHVLGDLIIDRAQINLSNLPGAGYTTLDVVFTDEADQNAPDAPSREAISLNVSVQSDRRIFVNGPGTESEWGVNARVTGPAGAPQINGEATLIRGDVDLLNRSFRMSEGSVRFLGDPEASEVSLQADRTNDGITTSILVTGPVLSPEISLSSDPTLPEDEILARVLFGRSPTNLSALQAAQLAAAAAQLAGGDALSLTGELEAATGLDRLDFGFDEDGGATLSTGKYLADDLYLEVESASSGAPGVTIEWTPLNNVEVDAELDPELGPKVAVQWRLDFDRLPGETPGESTARGSGKD